MHGVICRVAKLYCREQIHTSYTITDTGYELVVTTVLFGRPYSRIILLDCHGAGPTTARMAI